MAGGDVRPERAVCATYADRYRPGSLLHQLPGWENLPGLCRHQQIPALEAGDDAVRHLHLLLHLLCPGGGAHVLQHPQPAGGVAVPGPAERHAVLQRHGHARPLLPEEDSGPAADPVPVLWEHRVPGLVPGPVDQQPLPGHDQQHCGGVSEAGSAGIHWTLLHLRETLMVPVNPAGL